jgi:hypothetical protein
LLLSKATRERTARKIKKGPWCDHPMKLEMPRQIDPAPIYLAIGGPLGALLIGGGFFWALSGFRRSE